MVTDEPVAFTTTFSAYSALEPCSQYALANSFILTELKRNSTLALVLSKDFLIISIYCYIASTSSKIVIRFNFYFFTCEILYFLNIFKLYKNNCK